MKKNLSFDTCKQIAQTVINVHMAKGPCLFAPGAAQRIAVAGYRATSQGGGHRAIMDAFAEAIEAEEIYCPHEGIDRRAEFGIAA